MKNIFKLFLSTAILLIFTIQCSEKSSTNVVIDKAFCNTVNLPEISFSVTYPSSLKKNVATKKENYNYVDFYKSNGSKIIETIGISHYPKNSLKDDNFKKIILEEIFKSYKGSFDLSKLETFKTKIDGKYYYVGRSKGTAKNSALNSGLKGKYLIQALIIDSNENPKNGLFILFMSGEDSEIKTFEDFTSKGDISKVWKSLKIK